MSSISIPSYVVTAIAPALVAASGDRAAYRFLGFLTAQIRNPHSRRAGRGGLLLLG